MQSKRYLLVAVAAFSLLLTATAAQAGEIGSNKTFGIGLEVGHGPGLTLKYEPSPSHALQFGFSAFDYGSYRFDHGHTYYGYAYGYGGFFVHGEYLNQPGMLFRSSVFDLPWYWGGGLDLGLGAGSAAFAVHGNLGLAMQFKPLPIDIFLEWTPRIWVVDFVQFHPFDANAGIRVWF
jgi:hypothetical protein